MSERTERSIDEELRALLASYDASPSVEADERLAAEIRALARVDVDGFTRAMLGLESSAARSDAIEALVVEERFDLRFEPVAEAYADLLDGELAAHAEPGSDAAYQAALGYLVLGDLGSCATDTEVLERFRTRAEALLRHRHPDVRALGVTLVADLAAPAGARSLGALTEALSSDPDPVVRSAAFSELESLEALPLGARRPVLPSWFRGLRRYLAGG